MFLLARCREGGPGHSFAPDDDLDGQINTKPSDRSVYCSELPFPQSALARAISVLMSVAVCFM